MISGTAIGAGMLGLPIKNGPTGFPLAIFSLLSVYLFMLTSIFLYFENVLYMNDQSANLISMTKARLNKPLQYLTWLSYSIVHFSAIWAYLSAGGDVISSFLSSQLLLEAPEWQCSIAFSVIFGSLTFAHISIIDRINRLFMTGLFFSFALLFIKMTPMVQLKYLSTVNFNESLIIGIPVTVTAYTSHIIIPSLRDHFNNDIKSLTTAIAIGTFLPFLFYAIWELLILGMIPTSGSNSIQFISSQTKPLVVLLSIISTSNDTKILLVLFQMFALVTSFFGLSLSLRDFFRDGLKLDQSFRSRAIASAIALLPPLVLTLIFPDGFKKAINYIGSFDAICFIIIPVMMSWKARYIDHIQTEVKLPGGKVSLIIMAMLGTFVILTGLLFPLSSQ